MMQSVILSIFLILLVGCSTDPSPESSKSAQRLDSLDLPFSLKVCDINCSISDLEHYPQKISPYAQSNVEDRHEILEIQKQYEAHYFEPWHWNKPPETLESIQWPFTSYTADKMYGENLQKLPQSWFDTMYEASNFDAYGTVNLPAISLHFSHLRNFPTQKPAFMDPNQAGEGFPFDYIQNSGIHANEPLFISHYSKDGAWVYVFTSYATGWLRSYEIALIPKKYTQRWMDAQQVYLTNDTQALYNEDGNFVFYSRLGMTLPLIKEYKDHYKLLSVTQGKFNRAIYTPINIAKPMGNKGVLLLNRKNLSLIGDAVFHSHYGWGGLYEERDCSSTIRDLFAPFGIWLPRNSKQQSQIGKQISLKNLSDQEKLDLIRKEGRPFETLLYRKGHILLYLGTYDGEVMVLHNMWGIKTKYKDQTGRIIVGKTVISTLRLGEEQNYADKNNTLLKKIESMNILTLPAQTPKKAML